MAAGGHTKKNIVFVISSLNVGGAERVAVRLANHWAAAGHTVSIITLLHPGESFYELAPGVRKIDAGFRKIQASPRLPKTEVLLCVLALRRALKKLRPDVIIGFMTSGNVYSVLASVGWRVPVIISERVNPRLMSWAPVLTRLMPHTYPRADAIVLQTESVKVCFSPNILRHAHVIPNPVVLPATPPADRLIAKPDTARKTAMGLGRLTHQKGFDLLIQAFQQIAGDLPEWDLEILGEGEDRPLLEKLIAESGLSGRIRLPGETRQADIDLRAGDLFVMSSRFEGFPNALCEAMAVGLPAVSFDCEFGPAEIIRPGIDGLLAPVGDVPALAAAMKELMADGAKRTAMAARALEITERFSMENVVRQWEQVIELVSR
jgi:glycosyltransferase involved in cell wall biosynthesis